MIFRQRAQVVAVEEEAWPGKVSKLIDPHREHLAQSFGGPAEMKDLPQFIA